MRQNTNVDKKNKQKRKYPDTQGTKYTPPV